MTDFPVTLAAGLAPQRVESLVEGCCRELGLIPAMKSSLAKYPGSIHWHFRKPRAVGTLEMTLWPAKARLWITIQDGRRTPWTEETVPELMQRLQAAFS